MDPIASNFSNQQIDLSTLPNFESVDFTAVSRKYLQKMNIQTGIFMLVLFVALGALWFFYLSMIKSVFLLGLIILFFVFRFWNNYKIQKSLGFAIRERDMIYKRGYIFNKTTVIPFNRVQHASISRDIWDKLLGISSLKIFTAGGSGSDIGIPGLQPELALKLKEAIAVKISQDDS